MTNETQVPSLRPNEDEGLDAFDLLGVVASHWRMLIVFPVAAGAIALAFTYLIAPTFTAKTTFLPPQQQQSSTVSALASLSALSGLAGASMKTPGDQYVSLMQSVTLEDRIVDRFKLTAIYDSKYRFQARKTLEQNVRISLGKKDGLINIEADAHDPQLAANLANEYVVQLRRLTSELALTEAQGRRVFIETELKNTRAKLIDAQTALQKSGFNGGALKTEPQAQAEAFANLKAQQTAAEVRLQALRRGLADTAPEVQQQLATIDALTSQLSKLEVSDMAQSGTDYVSRYREFKYEEALFQLFSKEYESARLDESRDGGLVQVVDPATPPEYKSKPQRAFIAVTTAILAGVALTLCLICRDVWRRTAPNRRARKQRHPLAGS